MIVSEQTAIILQFFYASRDLKPTSDVNNLLSKGKFHLISIFILMSSYILQREKDNEKLCARSVLCLNGIKKTLESLLQCE